MYWSREFKQFWTIVLERETCLKSTEVENLSNSGRLFRRRRLLKMYWSREFKQSWTTVRSAKLA